MNITETEKEKIRNWMEVKTPEPPRYMLLGLEKAKEPQGNLLRVPILVGFDFRDMKREYLELSCKDGSWYLNN